MSEITDLQQIINEISSISVFDDLELFHKEDVLNWLQSGKEIYRIEKPNIPPKHLVVYFVLLDKTTNKIMLIQHIKSGLLLPPGGHVEKGESFKHTVERECLEELSIKAFFNTKYGDSPVFITVTDTQNENPSHTDVTIWYVLSYDSNLKPNFDKKEISECIWYSFAEVLDLDARSTDPHMHRFINKITNKFIV